MKKQLYVSILAVFVLFTSFDLVDEVKYLDKTLPITERIDDLMNRMTLDEKVAQLQIEDFITDYTDTVQLEAMLKDGLGVFSSYQFNLKETVASRNFVQKYLKEHTRLGIPVMFLDEGLHGVMKPDATSFPQAIGLACSWDINLYERVFTVVANEMRSRGTQLALSPVVDVCRDPRWGRVDETYGEDPYLNGKLGCAAIKGFQGSTNGSIEEGHVAATLKHFVGHGQPENGLNQSPANISERELREVHMKPFKMAIDNVNPFALMASYNEVDGVPSHKNERLLKQILREEWGYKGLIVSDFGGINLLLTRHFVANDSIDATLQAINAGIEVALPGSYFKFIPQLIANGDIDEKTIDDAVVKILKLKFETGLFDTPYCNETDARNISLLESSKELALEAAEKSIVLLKNSNNILPLQVSKYKKIAVIGPCADDVSLGSYPGVPYYKTSILEGIRKQVGNQSQVLYAKGCVLTIDSEKELNYKHWQADSIKFPKIEDNLMLVEEAERVAEIADVIILCVGENGYMCREAWSETHLGDAATLDLICQQNELFQAMISTGKPVITCLSNGRPLSVSNIAEKTDALLECWYMGQETGTAVANILFGKVSPSGKLTISIPRSVGQIPVFYNHKPSARHVNYVTQSNTPLFPFGFGLSYTSFSYSNPILSSNTIERNGNSKLSVMVTNTGDLLADEIVQFYIRDKVSSVTRPVKELKGFQRITLEPKESKTVDFSIDNEMLLFYDYNGNYVVEPGEFEIMVGGSLSALKSVILGVKN